MKENEDYCCSVDLSERNSDVPEEIKDRPYIRVYLASALTGREAEKKFDDAVRAAIREVLSKVSIRGEAHVIKYTVYNPAKYTGPGSPHGAEDVYWIDFKELVLSDLALFYVNAPSLGVGIERQIAATGAIPAGWICRKGEEVSRMFQGAFGGSLFNVKFDSVEELKLKLAHELGNFGAELVKRTCRRRRILSNRKIGEMPRLIFKARVKGNVGIEILARDTGIQAFWWEELQRDATGVIAATTFSPVLMCLISEILNLEFALSESGLPLLKAKDDVDTVQDMSLNNLYDAYVCWRKVVNDEVLLAFWREYIDHFEDSDSTLWRKGEGISKEEWLQKFEERENARFIAMLGANCEKLSDVEEESLANLYLFSQTSKQTVSDEIASKLWKSLRKHTQARKRAARNLRGKPKSYSIEDWREEFNKLHLDD